jgi:putative tryptophan/tyrosine transport system substrate-binding protein
MQRRAFVIGGITVLAAPLATEAQQAGRVPRVGYLGTRTLSDFGVDAFRQGLRELGWVEGRNIVVDYRFAEGNLDRLPDLAAELVRLNVDIIVAQATPGAAAAKNATQTIPIVMVPVGDPVGLGLVASLARPGGNITGVSYSAGGLEIIGKQLELLKETLPKIRRVAILLNPTNPTRPVAMRDVNAAAGALALQLKFLEAGDPNEFDGAFAAMAKERIEALGVMATMFVLHRKRLADLAAKSRLPAAYGWREHVEAGGLMSYGPSLSDLFRRGATFVDRILKGASPGDLPVEQPTKFDLVINLKTAKALGLTIPPSLLLRADQVIE